MLLLEAIFALLRRSLGRVVQAVFGWASAALFGELPKSRRVYVSLAIGLAASWPILLLGTVFPKLAAMLIAFVPLSDRVPESVVRAAWIGLALLVPLAVGWAMSRGFDHKARRILAGYPITLGLAGAFAAACIVVPIRKIAAMLSRRKYELVPLVVPTRSLKEVADDLRSALHAGAMELEPVAAPFSARVMTSVARTLGGPALGNYFLEEPPHLRGPRLELTLYPHGVRLLGSARETARAHALISEAAVWTRALQTMTPQAQKIERRIKRLGRAIARTSTRRRKGLEMGRELLQAIAQSPLEYADWEILHRQTLQILVGRSGEATPLERAAREQDREAVHGR
jgi:hypothetical protein